MLKAVRSCRVWTFSVVLSGLLPRWAAADTPTAAALRRAERAVVTPYRGQGCSVTLTGPRIGSLASRMRFTPARPCRCKWKYKIVFYLDGGSAITVQSWPHGWRFDGDNVAQRDDVDGRLTGFLDQLVRRACKRRVATPTR